VTPVGAATLMLDESGKDFSRTHNHKPKKIRGLETLRGPRMKVVGHASHMSMNKTDGLHPTKLGSNKDHDLAATTASTLPPLPAPHRPVPTHGI
jgi:hypothetical protein